MVNYGTRAYRPRSLNFLIVFRSPFRINSSEFVRRDCEGSIITMFMKLNFVCAFVCSAFLISSANAGGHHQGVGLSSSATTSTTATATGRSPLGEPVFLIPSSSSNGSVSAPSGGPIGGYVPPRTPLPPLHAPDPRVAALVPPASTSKGSTASGPSPVGELIGSSISTATAAHSNEGNGRVRVSPVRKNASIPELPNISGGAGGRGTRVVFTPPPTIVGVSPSVTGTGNIAGNNLADRTFGPSILSTGLGSNGSQPSSNVQTGSGGQSPAPWIRITPLQYNGPTVEVPTASSVSKTSSSTTATGH